MHSLFVLRPPDIAAVSLSIVLRPYNSLLSFRTTGYHVDLHGSTAPTPSHPKTRHLTNTTMAVDMKDTVTPSTTSVSEHRDGEKHDVEKVEDLSPQGLTTLSGGVVEMTWKTWLVIFVSAGVLL